MTERAAMLNAIFADPDDDLPRLVFADWCDEHGEPERAAVIRHQIRFRGGTVRWTADVMRPAERGSLPPLPLGGVTFHRGFVDRIKATADDAVRHLDAVLAAHPVTEVTLTTWPGTIDLLDACESRDQATRQRLSEMGRRPVGDIFKVLWPRVETWHLPRLPGEEQFRQEFPDLYRAVHEAGERAARRRVEAFTRAILGEPPATP